ncbi:hypothetical protein MW887_005624 [Aspergillus wentii]|nr:hypothetical protein MW887_005624 [Aspergillus wentii]
MLDEQSFRQSYMSKSRKDSRWLALLNTVLALGSIVAGTSDDTSHRTYFQRAKSYLGLDSLGCSDLETVQTLGLIGGYYLHYISQPNLAYSLMGAALRMAAALGLHKEFSNNRDVPSKQKIASMDLKRRVWWSLFCMDTWGSMTLGRPSMGRVGHAITVQLPHYRDAGNILGILPLIENIRFCKIATQIQEVLAVAPLVKHVEISHFDNQLLEWYDDLPSVLKDHESCSESILMTRTVMRWRYFNLRMLLYRPTLLNYAMRRVPYIALRAEERMAIERCREIAEVAIQDICATATQSQMSGWNAVWFIFQAAMVPLLGLFLSDDTVADPRATIEGCQAQVDMAMLVLARMQTWSPTAKRTLDAVARLFEASKRGPDISEETDSTSTGSYTAAHENYFHTITPPIVPSQPDAGRIMIAEDGGLPDALVSQFIDNSVSQDLWDYLSWSDRSMWPALSDSENTNDSIFLGHGDKDKNGNNNSSFLNSIADTAYLVNMSTSSY